MILNIKYKLRVLFLDQLNSTAQAIDLIPIYLLPNFEMDTFFFETNNQTNLSKIKSHP
jgi:hypothetical protein